MLLLGDHSLYSFIDNIKMISEESEWPKEGQYIDFKDSNSEWVVGYIINRGTETLQVRSDGWSSKYDIFLPANSNRLKPFRSIVRGYTGQQKKPGIRDHISFNHQAHESKTKMFQNFINQQSPSPQTWTQLVSGQHYFYIDFLMGQTYNNKQDLQLVYAYLQMHIQFSKKYLERMMSVGLDEWFDVKEEKDRFKAVYYEVFDGMHILTGNCARHFNFNKNNQKLFTSMEEGLYHEKCLEKIVKQTDFDLTYLKALEYVEKYTFKRLPIPFVFTFTEMFQCIQKALIKRIECQDIKKEQRKKIVYSLFKIVKNNIDQLKANELKDAQNEKEVEATLKNTLLVAFKYGLDGPNFEWIRTMKVRCASMLLDIDSIERKLKGIAQLKKLFQESCRSEYAMHGLSKQAFFKLLQEYSVPNKIFQTNQHPEIIKKGGELWVSMLKEQIVPFSQFEFIWTKSMTKHESVKKIVFQIWTDLISTKNQLSNQLTQLVVQRYKQKDDIFEKDQWQFQTYLAFAQKLFKNKKDGEDEHVISQQLCFQLVEVGYENLLKMSQNKKLSQILPRFVKTLLPCSQCNKIIKRCYSQIGKGIDIKVHILMLTEIYSQSIKPQTFLASNAFKIIFMILQTHNQHKEIIFELISELVNFSTHFADYDIFTFMEFQELWRISHAQDDIKDFFYNWLLLQKSQMFTSKVRYDINPVIVNELKSEIFSKILCDFNKLDYINLSLKQFYMFQQFLLASNVFSGNMEIKHFAGMTRAIKIKGDETIGNKFVWDIFMNCKNQQVLKQINQLIIILHLHYSPNSDQKTKKTKANSLMTKVQKHLRDGYRRSNYRILKAALNLLKEIIYFTKQKQILKANSSTGFKFTHKIKYNGKTVMVEDSFSSSYGRLKQKIASEIKLQATQFRLMSNKFEEIGRQYDCLPFCFMQDKQLQICKIDEHEFNLLPVIFDFINSKIYTSLVQMIEDEQVCKKVFQILEEMSVKENDVREIVIKICKTIDSKKNSYQDKHITNNEIYLLSIILKFIQTQPEELIVIIIQKNDVILSDVVHLLGGNFQSTQVVQFIQMSTLMLHKLLKVHNIMSEIKILAEISQVLADKCLRQISVISDPQSNLQVKEQNKVKITKICLNCLNIYEVICGKETVVKLFDNSSFCKSLEELYFNHLNPGLKYIFTEKIKKMVNACYENTYQLSFETEEKIILLFCFKLYPELKKKDGLFSKDKGSTHFYSFIAFMIQKCSQQAFKKIILSKEPQFYPTIFSQISKMSDSKDETIANYLLKIHLDILTSIYNRDPHQLTQDQIQVLLYEYLFFIEGKTKSQHVKCLRKMTISSCLKTLVTGIKEDNNKLSTVVESLTQLQRQKYWKIDENWSIESEPQKQQKYKGLQNPGCICFMNSFLQQLFMTQSFRSALINTDTSNNQAQLDCSVLQQLKQLFLEMVHSQENQLSAVQFSKSIKGSNQKPMISVYNQMDIDQFSNILFDRIENQLTGVKVNNFVRDIFGGVFAQQIVSHQCAHSSEREQQFMTVGLEVKKDLGESLSYLVKGQMLDGENKYYCEQCDAKVTAEKFLSIKKLPKCLIIALKRFQYDFEIDAKIKINSYCQFAHEINLKKYTQEEVLAKYLKEQNKVNSDQNCQYKLKGVVIHEGSADSGHYYSLIKDETRWIQFNDHNVTTFDVDKLQEQAFGSKDEDDPNSRNAYLLFYQKVQEESEVVHQEIVTIEENEKMIRKIEDKNKQIQKARIFFSEQYNEIVNSFWSRYESIDKQSEQYNKFIDFNIQYFLSVRLRQACLPDFIQFSKKMKQMIETDQICQLKFLQFCSSIDFLQNLYVYCTTRMKCVILSQIISENFLSYLNQNPDSLTSHNGILNKIVISIRTLMIIHGNINELAIILRIVLDKSIKDNDLRLRQLFSEIDFGMICLKGLIQKDYSKDEKIKALEEAKGTKIEKWVEPNHHKSITPEKRQSWKIFDIILCHLFTKKQQKVDILKEITAKLQDYLAEGAFAKNIFEAKTARTVSTIYSCLKNLNLLQKVLIPIEKGLKDFNSIKFRPLLLLIFYIVQDNDSDEQILVAIADMFERVIWANEKYFNQANIILQWMTKMMNTSQKFCEVMKQNQELLNQSLEVLDKHKKPSPDLLKKHKNPLNERLINKVNGLVVSADPKDYQKCNQEMQQKLINLQLNQFKPTTNTKLAKMISIKPEIGDKVTFLPLLSGNLKMATLVEKQFGKCMIKLEQTSKVIELDQQDERLSILTEQQAAKIQQQQKQIDIKQQK